MFDLKIGFKCNNNCIHCVVADKRPSGILDIPHLTSIIKSLPDGEQIVFTGGEPSIFSYLPDLLKFAYESGHPCLIQTNATGFADKEFAKKCAPYIYNAHVAIHSCYPEVHNSIVQDKIGTMWNKTIEGFNNLRELGVPCMTTQTVVTKMNIESVHDTFSWIQKHYPGTQMSFTYPHQMGNALKNAKDICFKYSDYRDEIRRILKDFNGLVFTESIPYCYLHPYIDTPCLEDELIRYPMDRLGIDFSDGMDTKDYKISDLKGRAKIPTCKECIYNKFCPGVWKEYIYLFKDKIDLFPIKNNESK